jgi:hypothetical protein
MTLRSREAEAYRLPQIRPSLLMLTPLLSHTVDGGNITHSCPNHLSILSRRSITGSEAMASFE